MKFLKPTFFLAITICIVLILKFIWFNGSTESSQKNGFAQMFNAGVAVSPSPSPFPFQELTIPHLRNRTYESNLRTLEKHEETQSYTSYLTNYDSDGLKINGLVTIPKGNPSTSSGDTWPAIIFVHGYIPPKSYQTTRNYADYVDYLARNGFVVFKIDLRGHGISEGEPGGAYYSADYVIDVLNARAALMKSDFVQPTRIGLWGHSMAGNVTFRSFVVAQDMKALVVWSGAGFTYNDLQEFGIDDNSYRPLPSGSESQQKRREILETYGTFDPNHEFWKQVTPMNYLKDVTGAIELHHARDDQVVSIEYSQNLIKQLDGTQIPHALHEHTGGHNITTSFNSAMQKTVEFYKKQLSSP